MAIEDLKPIAVVEASENKNIQLVIMPSSSAIKDRHATPYSQFRNSPI